MVRRKVRIPTTACDANDVGEICDINIEVKVAGVDLKSLSSTGKVFRANGREYPMSCFGSWVFHQLSTNQARQVCIDGGIIPSLIWGLLLLYPQFESWVTDTTGHCFTMQVDKSGKESLLKHITNPQMAKELQSTLGSRIPRIYKAIRIRSIKLLDGSSATSGIVKGGSRKKSSVAHDFECISGQIHEQNYRQAYAGLKGMINNKLGASESVHALILLGICCFHLEGGDKVEEIAKRLLRLMEKLEDCSPPLNTFLENVIKFAQLLEDAKMFTYSVNVLLACNEIIRKIDDSNERLDQLNTSLHICVATMRNILKKKPTIKMKMEFQHYLNKLEREVQYMKKTEGCDEVRQWRAVYFCLHALNDLKALMDKPVSRISAKRSMMCFACTESSWIDLTWTLPRACRSNEVASMLEDQSFSRLLKQISENPALLGRHYADPRIRKMNNTLNESLKNATPMSGFSRLGLENEGGVEWFKKRKRMGKEEKEKGDDAFEKMDYENAMRHYDKAIEIDPSEALHHCNKAAVYIRKNQLEKAEESCDTAMRIAQSNADQKVIAKVLAINAEVASSRKQYDAAMELYQLSLNIHDDMDVRNQLTTLVETLCSAALPNFLLTP